MYVVDPTYDLFSTSLLQWCMQYHVKLDRIITSIFDFGLVLPHYGKTSLQFSPKSHSSSVRMRSEMYFVDPTCDLFSTSSLQWCMQYHVKLDRIITSLFDFGLVLPHNGKTSLQGYSSLTSSFRISCSLETSCFFPSTEVWSPETDMLATGTH